MQARRVDAGEVRDESRPLDVPFELGSGEPVPVVDPVDIAWLLVCAALVLFMQAGFTALESGLVRSKNSINVAIKNFANFLIASSLFWLFGFGLMFGVDAGGVLGTSSFFFEGDGAVPDRVLPLPARVHRHGDDAHVGSGRRADALRRLSRPGHVRRGRDVPGLRPLGVGHAGRSSGETGSDGWLKELGFVDFAGSTVVHSVGWLGGARRDHRARPQDRALRPRSRPDPRPRPAGDDRRRVRALGRLVRLQRRQHVRADAEVPDGDPEHDPRGGVRRARRHGADLAPRPSSRRRRRS